MTKVAGEAAQRGKDGLFKKMVLSHISVFKKKPFLFHTIHKCG